MGKFEYVVYKEEESLYNNRNGNFRLPYTNCNKCDVMKNKIKELNRHGDLPTRLVYEHLYGFDLGHYWAGCQMSWKWSAYHNFMHKKDKAIGSFMKFIGMK